MSKLIEKEGKFYKECGVVILETTNRENTLWLNPKGQLIHTHLSGENKLVYKPQHLFITCDDEIKDGDFFIDLRFPNMMCPLPYSKDVYGHVISKSEGQCKKIIATTDPLLDPCCDDGLPKICNCNLGLPQPSDKFIQAYIDAYNKGEKIEKVLVEYELIGKKWAKLPNECHNQMIDRLKSIPTPPIEVEGLLKLKNNNIIIKKTKDSWTREEVEQLLFDLGADLYHKRIGNGLGSIEKWIEKNL